MPKDHFDAIVRWRDQLDRVGPGLDRFEQSATVSTMLYGCRSWLEHHGVTAETQMLERIRSIEAELTAWMAIRGRTSTI